MTVFKKIVRIKIADSKNPTKEIEIFQRQNPGIDIIPLQISAGIGQADFKLVCSDNNPTQPRSQEDIEKLLNKLDVVRELKTHPNDPETAGKVNHALQITANLDDPNIDDRFLKKGAATRIHDEVLPKEIIKDINAKYEGEKKKTLDEQKTHFSVGEVERG